ncbi:cell wall biogenesis protein phosphatase Ssd1 [Aspergillus heteromorphus CBS 117.55]|uniref:Cell wall biogenesis protein phosphatase Ssd1 n=1 Tax=Aspergillus heteromorphus CBS 117.55 TaxID=1448321 RepID=A0A317WX32_9EURO|nr:cell wall biogenesis protein phosphatase Ssd1 [Aspergillus heteromorphus CBS 117.55]PWY89757.1 cell wall biogenesis protein phosphatase Ssd1 [Aspergillus heteromorphus CBS 117.55]
MDQQGQSGVPGPAGRKLHIAHRRSPSELTPLMMEQLAIQQQIELLQQQQQQIAATHQQYVNMGLLQPQQLGQVSGFPPSMQGGASMGGVSPQLNAFQFPQLAQQQQLGVPMNPSTQHSHRRNQSALPGLGMGPPPAPSSGASGYSDYGQQQQGHQPKNENGGHGRGRGGPPGGGHQRRHSLALPEAKKAAELAQQKRTASGFQFPPPSSTPGDSESPQGSDEKLTPTGLQPPQGLGLHRAGNIRAGGHGRSQSMAVGGNRGSLSGRGAGGFQFPQSGDGENQRRGSQQGHARSSSRNFDGNWRQPNNQPQGQDQQKGFGQQSGGFQPGHRTRASMNQSIGSIGSFQYPGQPQLIQLPQGQVVMAPPQMFGGGQQLNPLQLAQLQALQQNGQLNGQSLGLQASQHAPPQLSAQQQQQQQQQQRKTLFTPYLPQANLPALLSNGQLVAGILRVNKKNRSDAYVTTPDLDADIFICGSKDRNRALEGDYVAIELLDVDEVWSQKKEKEEKKKRKDITEARAGSNAGTDKLSRSDSGPNGDRQEVGPDGSIRRRGSLRQRPTQKKNDDVEVEGQSLLLVEEDEISDDQKPLYAGHVVAVIERIAGQMFSGTLGLLRPSSQATKEKQEAERLARDGGHGGRQQQDRQQDKPKIVWFKPTDKRVPLIAIPTEQAPRDFVEKHQDYANRIFVACIKRWPITSLHPFGTLVEQLGEMGDLRVETEALLRDNNFGSDEFSDAVLKSIGWEDWSVSSEGDAVLTSRRDYRQETTFTINPGATKELDNAFHFKPLDDGKVEVGIHVTDIAHFVKGNSLVDREAKKRGTAVYLVDRLVNMLPPRVSTELCALLPGEDRFTVSVVFKANPETGAIDDDVWIGKAIIKSSGKLSYEEVDAAIQGTSNLAAPGVPTDLVRALYAISSKFREARLGNRASNIPPLRLLHQLDDENVPVENNIFDSSPVRELVEELSYKANFLVARKLVTALPEKAFLRRQLPPSSRRLHLLVERMNRLGFELDPASSGTLQSSLCNVQDDELRKGMETILMKAMQRAKYFVASSVQDERVHYTLNLPVYTHFTNPSRRYADIMVHRQLEAVLSNGAIEFSDDLESLNKTADLCNNKKDSAHNAQEQSVHIEACRNMDKERQELGGDLISEGIVICVYESAFDVLIPEYGFEKRVHCDQLPLKKAEYRKDSRVLELYWEKGVPSSAYIPEDERPKPGNSRAAQAAAAAREAEAARERAREREEAMRRQTETGTMSADDVDALFDDDDDVSEVTEMAAGVSLNSSADRSTQSMPPSPTRNGHLQQAPHRTRSDPKIATISGDAPEAKLTNKEKYLRLFKLREEDGEYIQDVTEMTRVPIILKTDLSKSPPCLTIRSVNPYAL